jgi:uncharacterized protein YbjT (DUF2867 family)
MPPLIFVAGATGYTGRALVRLAAARGIDVVAHVRPDSPSLTVWTQRFEGMGGRVDRTPWEEEAMTATLARLAPTHVFALLGTTRSRGKRGSTSRVADTYEAVDYGLTAMLLRAAVAAARAGGRPPRFVYLSAIGASEDTRNDYLRVRGRVERELRASGLPWLAVRPSFVTGADRDERRPLERIGALAADGALSLAALLGARRLRARWGSLTGTELAAGMLRLALAEGESRVVGGEELRG